MSAISFKHPSSPLPDLSLFDESLDEAFELSKLPADAMRHTAVPATDFAFSYFYGYYHIYTNTLISSNII